MTATLPSPATSHKPYTRQQQAAIEMREQSVALSAGAGCGKTFVLTERFLSHLEPGDEGAPPAERLHQIIAITFTDRAAREMRNRIRKTCYDRLQAALPKDAGYWLGLLRSLDSARVSTIHAFCGALLRAHAVEAQLDPQFAVVEQTQAETLLAEAIEDVLRETLSEAEHQLHAKALNLTGKFDLKRLRQLVAELLSTGVTIDWDQWQLKSAADIVALWREFHRARVVPAVVERLIEMSSTRSLLQALEEMDPPAAMVEAREMLLAELPTLREAKDPAARIDALREAAKVKEGKKAWGDEAEYERFRDAAKAFRDDVDQWTDCLQFDAEAAIGDAEAGLQLLELAREVAMRYQRKKSELAWLDFNDLLIRAHRLLTDPAYTELQRELSGQVRLLLVDECQDTDPMQVELIRALCGDLVSSGAGKLFFVGDYKQSIYRFRGADPQVFRDLQDKIPKAGRLPLTENFRSQPAILNFVNALFCEALSAGDDRSLAYQPLVAHRKQVTEEPAVEFLWTQSDEKKSGAGATERIRRCEADLLARRIRRMLDERELLVVDEAHRADSTADQTGTRPVELMDIAILFRSLSDVQYYEEALRKYEIQYYLVGGHAFYAQQEIFDIVNLLRALASSADAVSLAGVLRSPMFAVDDETLYWLAQHPQGLAAGLNAERLPNELTENQRRRARFAAATLAELRESKDRLPIAGLLNRAMSLTGYDAAMLAEFMGERKLANLRKLIEQARVFDQSGALGLADFVVQLSEFVVQLPREALAATHPEGTNVVRLMTIHQAKGLEFPVVFVPDIGRSFHGNTSGAIWDPELGPLVKVPARSGKAKGQSGLDLHQAIAATEDEAEWMRLFYVATTRAKDYLVLSSGVFVNDLLAPKAPWIKLLAERFNLESGEFIGVLPSDEVYQRPRVRVTTKLPEADTKASGYDRKDLAGLVERAIQLAESATRSGIDPARAAEDVRGRLAEWIEVDAAARRRYSVSRLSGELQLADEDFSIGAFDADGEQTGIGAAQAADLGTIVHRALAVVKFSPDSDVRQLVDRVVDRRTASAAELAEHAAGMLERFLKSGRAAELAGARHIHRELEFLLAWPPDVEQVPGEATKYLQGFIDCLYQDATEGWHLLDYKTNQVAAEKVRAVAKQYEMQLGVYALAIEEIFGQPPVEIAVHFLRPGREQRFVWNEDFRGKIIEQVNRAIGRLVVDDRTLV